MDLDSYDHPRRPPEKKTPMPTQKRISLAAYQALREALPAVTWYKSSFRTLLHTSLRDHPELLSRLNFSDSKRLISSALIDTLTSHENKYQDTTIQMMVDISAMDYFLDFERLTEPDRTKLLNQAKSAVSNLRRVTKEFSKHQQEQDRIRAEQAASAEKQEANRAATAELESLKARFLELTARTDNVQQRGLKFEILLRDLFDLADLEPRMAYSLEYEQIDGAFTYDSDVYLLEAKWLKGAIDRASVDAFNMKVQRKGKNALGLIVSVNGFPSTVIDVYSTSTSFITMDGADLFAVLDGRYKLEDLLRLKKRHANETGSCYYPLNLLNA